MNRPDPESQLIRMLGVFVLFGVAIWTVLILWLVGNLP